MKTFREKVLDLRGKLGISQKELSEKAGIGKRTLITYEAGERFPQPAQLYKLAKALGVSPDYLKNDDIQDPSYGLDTMDYIEETRQQYGAKDAYQVEELLTRNAALFAGGDLSEEAKDAFFQAIMKAYVSCKESAKKTYSSKKSKSEKDI